MIQKCISTFTKVGERIITRLTYNCVKYSISSRYYSYKTLNKDHWSILFFGTDEFALLSLKALHDSCREKKLHRLEIVTAYKGEENNVIKYARDHGICIHSWPPQIQENEFEIGVVVSFGHLIPSKIIELFPLGMINVHGSLLPRWRGAAPICHALMNGDTQTGVTIMKIMPKKFDIGSIIAQRAIEIRPEDTYIELYSILAELGSELLMKVISELPDVLMSAKPQTEDGVTYAPKITKEMSYIKWNRMTAKDICNLQRALNGIHPLRSNFDNEIIKLENVKEVPADTIVSCPQGKVPGLVLFNKRKKQLYIACQGNSWITVGTIILPNRRPQLPADFGSGFIQNRKEKSCLFY